MDSCCLSAFSFSLLHNVGRVTTEERQKASAVHTFPVLAFAGALIDGGILPLAFSFPVQFRIHTPLLVWAREATVSHSRASAGLRSEYSPQQFLVTTVLLFLRPLLSLTRTHRDRRSVNTASARCQPTCHTSLARWRSSICSCSV